MSLIPSSFLTSAVRSLWLAGIGAALPLGALTPAELEQRLLGERPPLVVDLRPQHAFSEASIPGSIHVPASLLDRREFPGKRELVLVADGLGQVDAQAAAAVLRNKGVGAVEILDGGFQAWLAHGGADTRAAGVSREQLPAITYRQAMNSKEPMAILDVRPKSLRNLAGSPDPVADFARKLGDAPVLAIDADAVRMVRTLDGKGRRPDPVALANAAVGRSKGNTDRLLLIVSEDPEAAEETARRLRTAGSQRHALLIGGVEAIRREGRPGLERQGGSLQSIKPQP